MKKIVKISVIVLIVLALGLIKFFNSGGQKAPSNTKQGKPPVLVTARVVQPSKLGNEIVSSGTLSANQEVELHSEISARIIQLNFKEGSIVSKGDLLIKMYDSDLQAQLKKLLLQEELAVKNEARQKQLLTINGISQQDYDNILNQLNTVRADIDITKTQISKTEIRAPFNGTIGLRYVSEGSYITPTNKIAALQQLDPIKIDFSVPEKYSNMVHAYDSIHFTVSSNTKLFSGSVYAVEPKIDLSTRSIMVRAICPNKKGELYPGSFAKVFLRLKENTNALMIPTECVIPELKGQKIFIVKNGLAQPSKVTTGTRTDSTIEITSGLHAGDSIVTTGIMQLGSGSPIRINKESKK